MMGWLWQALIGKFKTPSQTQGTFSQGTCYDLQEIYEEMDQKYFNNRLKLRIAWSGSKTREAYRYRRLGSFNPQRRLIKIHRLLDHAYFPPYFVSYVVYHEMLHHVCPPKKGVRGRRRIHHRAFKELEKRFEHYHLAKAWEKENFKSFFTRM